MSLFRQRLFGPRRMGVVRKMHHNPLADPITDESVMEDEKQENQEKESIPMQHQAANAPKIQKTKKKTPIERGKPKNKKEEAQEDCANELDGEDGQSEEDREEEEEEEEGEELEYDDEEEEEDESVVKDRISGPLTDKGCSKDFHVWNYHPVLKKYLPNGLIIRATKDSIAARKAIKASPMFKFVLLQFDPRMDDSIDQFANVSCVIGKQMKTKGEGIIKGRKFQIKMAVIAYVWQRLHLPVKEILHTCLSSYDPPDPSSFKPIRVVMKTNTAGKKKPKNGTAPEEDDEEDDGDEEQDIKPKKKLLASKTNNSKKMKTQVPGPPTRKLRPAAADKRKK